MKITPGQSLLNYRIEEKIGAGGMGEVWSATDVSLDRKVAVKVLPEALSRDAERMARFEREARLLASLNHAGIAAVYGLHETEGTRFLAMELIPGEDLTARIEKGALPAEAAMAIALQVAQALEAAHDHGVIHRDLKPANIRITPDGRAKVLDFGLAKAFDAASPIRSGDASLSPTLTAAHTSAGIILGTASYMSPEQAAGQPTDKRSDIWSFGVILYEMLSGDRLFQGETVSHTLADVLRADIRTDRLPGDLPGGLGRLIRRCLERDPRRRLRDIGEARIALEDLLAGEGAAEPAALEAPPATTARRPVLPWAVAGLAVVAAAVSTGLLLTAPSATPPKIARFSLATPTSGLVRQSDGRAIAISPDGTRVVSRGSTGSDDLLYMRALDSFDIRPLSGTNGGQEPRFSPDGRWLAYTTPRGLHKVNLAGGAPVLLGAVPASLFGLTWSDDGFIYYGASNHLWRISADGSEPQQITSEASFTGAGLSNLEGESSGSWRNPFALPSGKALIFNHRGSTRTSPSRLMAFELDSGLIKDLGLEGSCPLYLPTGHLLYVSGEQVLAVEFDEKALKVTGTPVPVLERVWIDAGVLQLDFSENGTVAYIPRRPGEQQRVVLVDRRGYVQPLTTANMPFETANDVRLSPDGRWLVLTSGFDIWVLDLETQTPTLLAESGFYPVWSADSRSITFSSARDDSYDLYQRSIDLSRPNSLLLDRKNNLRSQARAPDGTLIVREEFPGKGMDLWIWPDEKEESSIRPLLDGEDDELAPAVSPDGRWLAYVSDQSGRDEIYVTGFPGAGGRVQVSAGGGSSPAWSPDGRELYYLESSGLVAAKVTTVPSFRVLSREKLFGGSYVQYRWYRQYDVHPDGEHFIMIESPAAGDVEIVLNWFQELDEAMSRLR